MIAWLLDTLVYTGALIALVLVARRTIARLFGAGTAYALWALPFLRLLLPPIELPASLAPAASPLAPYTAAAAPAGHLSAMTGAADAAQAPAAGLANWPVMIVALWLGGALAFLAWRAASYRAMRGELLADTRAVGEVGPIRLVESPCVTLPVAFGVRDKVVALPLLFMAQPDLEARDLAIAHELEHHRGRDLAANFAAQALLALHWFNPLAWLGWRAMRHDQEAACDARVLAGRERGERVRYARLIAGTAAGPRLALAASMACPVLGDASIVHRLRSLTMPDISPRRRRAGRLLVAGAALALPLTASFSYAAAQDAPAPPAPPAPPAAADPPAPPALAHGERRVERFVVRTDGDASAPRAREERRVMMFREGSPGDGVKRKVEFNVGDGFTDPAYQQQMAEWSKQMEAWGRRYGNQMQAWGAHQRTQVRRFVLVNPGEMPQPPAAPLPPMAPRLGALPLAPHIPPAPEVIENCDGQQGVSTATLGDGRQRVIICNRMIRGHALAGLRGARERIAGDSRLSEDVRHEVLEDLDREIDGAQKDGSD